MNTVGGRKRRAAVLLMSTVLLFVLFFVSLTFGRYSVPFFDVIKILGHRRWTLTGLDRVLPMTVSWTEAMEKARAILIRHLEGYTIQEAHGGWVGDGVAFRIHGAAPGYSIHERSVPEVRAVVRKLVVPVAVERHHRNPARTFRKRRRSSEQRGKDSRLDHFHCPLHSLKTDGSTTSGFFPSGAVT